MKYTQEYLLRLLDELRTLPKETEWIEFKHNYVDTEEIGTYISAIANSTALSGKQNGYLVWGIDNDSHEIIGTTFNPALYKVGNEELENWLLRLLAPKGNFSFYSIETVKGKAVILEIERAFRHPMSFKNMEYIRIGSYKKHLKDFPEKERELWRIFDATPFENIIAQEDITSDDVLTLLDYPEYFYLMKMPLPDNKHGIIEKLIKDFLIIQNPAKTFNITTLRERFGIKKENSAMISRIIKDTLEKKLIKFQEPETESRKYTKYVPFWA